MKRKQDSSSNTKIRPRAERKAHKHVHAAEDHVHEPEILPAEAPAEEESEPDQDEADFEPEMPAEIAGQLPTVLPSESETRRVGTERESEFPIPSSVGDPLRRYMDELRRYPLLEPEEEFRLALRLRNEGDVQAAKTLVSANLRLVVKIALEYRTFYSSLLDLIQEGNVGLMKAVSKFDPTRGARLGYYASWWIRSYILKYLLDNFRLVKIGTTQAQKKLFYHLMREKERIEAQGLLGGPKLLAERLNVREKDIVEMEQRLSGQGAEMSLDAPVSSDDERATSHLAQLADESETAEQALERHELLAVLREKLPEFQKDLNPKELSILRDRLLAEEPKTLQEVANLYGLTRERARQIEAKLISKLKDFLRLS